MDDDDDEEEEELDPLYQMSWRVVVRYCRSVLEGVYPGQSAIQAPKPLEEGTPLPGAYYQAAPRKGDRQLLGTEEDPRGYELEGDFTG